KLTDARHLIQDPADLERTEITRGWQAGSPAKEFDSESIAVSRHVLSHAGVLPDDGVVNRNAGAAIPEHRGFALVRDADGGKIAGCQVAGSQRAGHHRLG